MIIKIKEKRKFPRVPVHYDILCEKIGEGLRKKIYAIADNASKFGLKINLPAKFRKGEMIRMDILKSPDTGLVLCCGEIIWTRPHPFLFGEMEAGVRIKPLRSNGSKLDLMPCQE